MSLAFIVFSFFLVFFLGGSFRKFSVPYSLGIVLALSSTFFLVGPLKQAKMMFHKKRILATIFLILTIAATLVCALVFSNKKVAGLLVILFLCLQVVAFFWYAISYIPYARTGIKKLCACCF